MEVLVLDGKSYVKASKAARELGYATDYVGQLCRSGQVDAHLIGRTWYVNQDELGTYKVEKKRISRTKAREYAKKTIAEYRTESTNNYKNIDIRYEDDTESLLPTTRKVTIKSEPVKKEFAYEEHVDGDDFEIVNKGEKVVMSGDLTVVDVTDGVIDTETTVLKPKLIPPEKISEKSSDVNTEKEVLTQKVQKEQSITRKISFTERLGQQKIDESPSQDEANTETSFDFVEPVVIEAISPSRLLCASIIIAFFAIVIGTLGTSRVVTVTHLGGTTAIDKTEYSWTTASILNIWHKI